MSAFRNGTINEYVRWLASWLENGNSPTHHYDYPFARWTWLTAQQDFTTGGECGARAVRIIVPPGIRHIGGELGHNDLYFMDGPCAAGGVVPVFSDPAFEPLGLGEFIAAQRAEDAERRAEVEEDNQRGREAAAHSDIGIHLGRTPAR